MTHELPPLMDLGLLLGLSLFLGLAFEDFFSSSKSDLPGGIRTFPLLALAGGGLFLLDRQGMVPFAVGLAVLGSWLFTFYRERVRQETSEQEPRRSIVVPLLNVHAYLLGAIALATPNWFAVGTTVCVVLLLTGREQLHALARRVDIREIHTAGQFLILTGIILPLLPDTPITTLTGITPRQVWLALVVVCSLSYFSYLARRYWPPASEGLWMAAFGGLYSSTAMTVVLAREASASPEVAQRNQAGITLATGIMYLRILVIIAVFNFSFALKLFPALAGLAVLAFLAAAWQYRFAGRPQDGATASLRNPLEMMAAAVFAILFIATTVVSKWVMANYGSGGIYTLAAIVGVTDIDPFVLNLAQGGTTGMPPEVMASAVLIATSSNNVLKAIYALGFAGWRAASGSVLALLALALAGCTLAVLRPWIGF